MANALGGDKTPCDDKRMKLIFEALLDQLTSMPEFHGVKGELAGLMVIPLGIERDGEGNVKTSSGLTSYVGKGHVIPPIAFTRAISDAGIRWYSWANGDRVNVLESYASGSIELNEVERLLGEPLSFTAQNLGVASIPSDRTEVAKLTQALRLSLGARK